MNSALAVPVWQDCHRECRGWDQGRRRRAGGQHLHRGDQVRGLGADRGVLDAGRGHPLGRRLGQPGAAAGRGPARQTGGHPGASVRLRPGALRLRLHRRRGAVQRRRPVRALRGVPQVRTKCTRHEPNVLLEGRWWWVPLVVLGAAIIAESFSFRTAIVESNKVRGKQGWKQVHPLGQGAGAAGDPAGGLRRPARSGLRPVRRRNDAAHPERILRRHRHGHDRVAAGAVAITLAVETKSLLLGEAASSESVAAIEHALTATQGWIG